MRVKCIRSAAQYLIPGDEGTEMGSHRGVRVPKARMHLSSEHVNIQIPLNKEASILSFPFLCPGHVAEDSGLPACPLIILMQGLLSEECLCPGDILWPCPWKPPLLVSPLLQDPGSSTLTLLVGSMILTAQQARWPQVAPGGWGLWRRTA